MTSQTADQWLDRTHVGDCRALLRRMAADGVRVQCIVTSPPYWGLRDYGIADAIGMEPTLQEWLDVIADVFQAAWDVLSDDGVLWLNLGDAYANDGKWGGETGGKQAYLDESNRRRVGREKRVTGLKPKDLMGQPWRVALALQDSGWHLRADCIWHKVNPMPESVTDRPTKSHEYVFLLSKQPRYYYDAAAIAEPVTGHAHPRGSGVNPKARSQKDNARNAQGLRDSAKFGRGAGFRNKQNESFSGAITELVDTRNIRTVWTFPIEPQPEAHFATFPHELVERCVLASSRPQDIVLDPFMGSGTVARVAISLGRRFVGCELNPAYTEIQNRISLQAGMGLT